MARIEKTVFISYRRVDRWTALAVFKDLTQHGYDVFIDYDGIASGDFERAIVDNIKSRAHFLLLLTPTALEHCDDPEDWLRREIEVALDASRNIVPLMVSGFSFDSPLAVQRLHGKLEPLRRKNGIVVSEDYFDAAMERLRGKFLAVPTGAVIYTASEHAQEVARGQQESDTEAMRWYRKSADQGNGTGETGLGLLYATGSGGVPKDAVEAVKWYRKAADHGNARGESNLGVMYEYGLGGLTKDEVEAVKWYVKSAEQGDSFGQAYLADMYERGRGGLTKDLDEARSLYKLAAAQGSEYAKKALSRIGEN